MCVCVFVYVWVACFFLLKKILFVFCFLLVCLFYLPDYIPTREKKREELEEWGVRKEFGGEKESVIRIAFKKITLF